MAPNDVQRACWFCEKRETSKSQAYQIAVAGRSIAVPIPRCEVCEKTHKLAAKAFLIAFFLAAVTGSVLAFLALGSRGGLLGGYLLGALGAIAGVPIGIAAYRKALGSTGTKPHRHGLSHPDVLAARGEKA